MNNKEYNANSDQTPSKMTNGQNDISIADIPAKIAPKKLSNAYARFVAITFPVAFRMKAKSSIDTPIVPTKFDAVTIPPNILN